MKDYSQSGEQAAILAALLKTDYPAGSEAERRCLEERGTRFLDIGAYHPEVFSNTRALYELGWSGVMIEAAPGPMRALLGAYGNEERITLVQAAVALAPGLVDMRISDDAVSTSNPASYETWKTAGGYIGKLLVPAITPAEIFNRFGGFDFINVDIEGGSADVFLECLKLKVFPKCWCVEVDNGRLNKMMTAAGAACYVSKVIGANLILWQ